MKRIKYIIALCLSLICFTSLESIAQQSDIYADYYNALQLYDLGMADSALNVLRTCIKNKKELNEISKERHANIFRLAALSAIMTDNIPEAEGYVKQLVTYEPDYRHNFRENDLTEFRLMVDKAVAQPSVRLGATGGINLPFVNVHKQFSDYESPVVAYNIGRNTGYQFCIIGEKALTKRISMELSAGITKIRFQYSTTDQQSNQYKYNQSITYMEIPVIGRYNFLPEKPFKPYLQAGLSSRFSLSPRETSVDYGKYWYTASSNSSGMLTTFETDIENIGLVAGGGIGYDLKNFSLRLDFRYNHNFISSSKASAFDNINGYDDIPETEKFHYTDDINLISLKYLQISAGFLYNLKYKVF